jgi:type III secretory pathway component EscU
MENKLTKLQKHLKAFDRQQKLWLVLSGLVVIAVSDIVFNWTTVTGSYLIWILVSFGLLVAVVWWYWTMRLIRQLIDYRLEESEILQDIVIDIRDIKKEVKEYTAELIDKSK